MTFEIIFVLIIVIIAFILFSTEFVPVDVTALIILGILLATGMLSIDDGLSWKGVLQFGNTGSTNYIIETEPNIIQVFHEVEEDGTDKLRGTIFNIKRNWPN